MTRSKKLAELEKLFDFEVNKRLTNSLDEVWSREVRRSIIFEARRIKNANVYEDYDFTNL